MEQLAVGFLLGILSAGVGAIFTQQISSAARDRAMRRALLAEIEQNAVALEPFAHGATSLDPVPRLHRDAWIAAHSLPWPRQRFLSVAALYVTIDGYEGLREMIVARETGGTQVLHLRMQAQTVGKAALELVEGAKKAAR
jgi:hypothetical protein